MSIKDTAQSIIKSINDGDTLTSVSLSAENFHEDTVKLVSVLVGKKLGGIYVQENQNIRNRKLINESYQGKRLI